MTPAPTQHWQDDQPLLSVSQLSKFYSPGKGCGDISFDLHAGEVLGIVGESGSGKSTLLNCLSARLQPDSGQVLCNSEQFGDVDIYAAQESQRRVLMRSEWGIVHQHARDGLRMNVSAGANIGERLMAVGQRHYGDIRAKASEWLEAVEIDTDRIDDKPTQFSGGMQQRLQIARNLVTHPRLIFMDEPTGGLDVIRSGPTAGSAQKAGIGTGSVGNHRHSRSGCGTIAGSPPDCDAPRCRCGNRFDRSGTG